MARRTRNLLTTLLLLGVVGSVAGWGVYSAFTATTTNSGNTITAGTVSISQHAGSTTLYSLTNQGPGSSTVKCIRVTYGGSLASSVKLYTSAVTNGAAFNLQVERGSGITAPDNTMNCTGFTASSTAYNGTLGYLPGNLRRRRRRQGSRCGVGTERFGRLSLHHHRGGRRDAERPHQRSELRCAHVHVGGQEQLGRASQD